MGSVSYYSEIRGLAKKAVRFANAHLNAMKPREDGAPTFVR